jgi:hypothetical protein
MVTDGVSVRRTTLCMRISYCGEMNIGDDEILQCETTVTPAYGARRRIAAFKESKCIFDKWKYFYWYGKIRHIANNPK